MSRLRRVEAVAIVVAVLLLVVAPPAVSRARIGPAILWVGALLACLERAKLVVEPAGVAAVAPAPTMRKRADCHPVYRARQHTE